MAERVFSRMRRSVMAKSIPTKFCTSALLGRSNIFDMTSKSVEGFRRGEGAKIGLSHTRDICRCQRAAAAGVLRAIGDMRIDPDLYGAVII